MSSHNFDLPDPAGCAGDRIRRAEQAGDSDGWRHTKLTLNYPYRGLWGSIASILVMFAASSFTRKTDPAKLEKLTVSWKRRAERFRGIFDWRLQVAVFSAVTVALYWLIW